MTTPETTFALSVLAWIVVYGFARKVMIETNRNAKKARKQYEQSNPLSDNLVRGIHPRRADLDGVLSRMAVQCRSFRSMGEHRRKRRYP
jgi:hypothetical protein